MMSLPSRQKWSSGVRRVAGVCALVVWSVLSIAFTSPSAAAQPARPNFVVIFCDDLGYGDLACFGHPTIRTPNLDQMASEGQKWTNFYVGASVCTPSRAALLTGRLPIRNGMMSFPREVLFPDSSGGLPASEITIAEMLQQDGYATAAIGKWHLGHLPEFLPTNHGFDYYWGIPYSNDMDAQPGFAHYESEAGKDANYIAQVEQYNVPILENNEIVERPANQHTITERYTNKAIAFIEENKDRPFFVYLAHSLPHIPLFAGTQFRGKSPRGLYGDVVEEIDSGIGKIVSRLHELDLAQNTLIVFTSDNGPWLTFQTHGGSAGLLRDGKGTTFEGGMRVPTIFWWADHIQPGTNTSLGTTMDLFPTFCRLAGIPVPQDRALDGHDLSSLNIGNATKEPRDTVFYWRAKELYAVRQGTWKAHFIIEGSYGMGPEKQVLTEPMLYNVDEDPSERFDLARLHPDIVSRLEAIATLHKQSIEPAEDQLAKTAQKQPILHK